MTDELPVPGRNDVMLIRAMESENAKDVFDLFKMCNYKIKSFSNHALNWSVVQACYKGHALLVQFLLQDRARLEVSDDIGNTPILICSTKGMSDIVRILLAKGADVNATNNNGDTALILTNSREVIHILLCQKGIEVNHQNNNGYTALMSAIEDMNLNKAKQLILAGACPESQVNHEDINGSSNPQLINTSGENALQIAHRKGVGALVEILHHSYLLDQHPLLFSVVNGNLESCNALLLYGLFDNNEIISIRPNILCVVLNFIKDNNICAGNREIELVTRLCQSGLNINKCSDCDKSPLDIVMEIGNYDFADILCQYGVIIPHQAIINLVIKENINLIPLFAVHGAVINQLDENCTFQFPGSALDVALKNSQIGCANVLLYHGSQLDVKYALNQAVDSSNVITLEFLLRECQEETKHLIHNNSELFHKAVRIGDLTVIEILLEAGADIDGVCENKTHLMNAIDLNVIHYLLNKGANVNKKVNTTALINLISSEYLDNIKDTFMATLSRSDITEKIIKIINLFLKFGAHLEATDDTGNTVFIKSVEGFCNLDIMKFLLHNGSNVNEQNSKGQSALYRATQLQDLDKINILLNYGADLNLQCYEGLTPLHVAIESLDIVKVLLKHQANINVRDRNGNTPLLLASKSHDDDNAVNVVSLLIESGSIVNQTNSDGMTALMLAAQKCNESTMIVLLNSKAEVNVETLSCSTPMSALSILLNKWLPSRQSQFMALKLIEEGATAAYVRPDALHRIIVLGNKQLVRKLIMSGLCPTDIVLNEELIDWPMKNVSPLSICLIKDNMELAKYLIQNWYLTKSDIKILSKNERILENVNSTTRQYLNEVSTEPLRLELLSFICVSTALGSGTDREEKVKKSPLPPIFKEYLLFHNVKEDGMVENAGEDTEDENDDDLNVLFIHELTYKHKQCSKVDDLGYYENDDSFDETFLVHEDSDVESTFEDSDVEIQDTLEDSDVESLDTLEDSDLEISSTLEDSDLEISSTLEDSDLEISSTLEDSDAEVQVLR